MRWWADWAAFTLWCATLFGTQVADALARRAAGPDALYTSSVWMVVIIPVATTVVWGAVLGRMGAWGSLALSAVGGSVVMLLGLSVGDRISPVGSGDGPDPILNFALFLAYLIIFLGVGALVGLLLRAAARRAARRAASQSG